MITGDFIAPWLSVLLNSVVFCIFFFRFIVDEHAHQMPLIEIADDTNIIIYVNNLGGKDNIPALTVSAYHLLHSFGAYTWLVTNNASCPTFQPRVVHAGRRTQLAYKQTL